MSWLACQWARGSDKSDNAEDMRGLLGDDFTVTGISSHSLLQSSLHYNFRHFPKSTQTTISAFKTEKEKKKR